MSAEKSSKIQIGNFALGFLGSIASIVGVIITIFQLYGNADESGKWGLAIVGGISIIHILIAGYFFRKWVQIQRESITKSEVAEILSRKDASYGRLFSYLNQGFSPLHSLLADKINSERTQLDVESPDFSTPLYQAFENLCSSVSDAFTLLTEKRIAVCIKILHEGDSERTPVTTLCRDRHSKTERGFDRDKVHSIEENTAFSHFYNQSSSDKGRYFFSNQLPEVENYQNTSIEFYPHHAAKPNMTSADRRKYWGLPYKSTIVVPVRRIDQNDYASIIGFLCVDSTDESVFDEETQPVILQGIADGIYNSLNELRKILDSSHE